MSPDLLLDGVVLWDKCCKERTSRQPIKKPPGTRFQLQERHLLTQWIWVPAVQAGDGQQNRGEQDGDQHDHQRPSSSIHDPAVDDRKWFRGLRPSWVRMVPTQWKDL